MSTSGLFDELQGHDPDAEEAILAGGHTDTPEVEEEEADKKPAKKTGTSTST